MRVGAALLVLVLAGSCGPPSPGPPVVKDPPRVFLSTPDANTIAETLSVTVNVSGCDKVSQIRIRQGGTADVHVEQAPAKNPTQITITRNELNAFYGPLGIAVKLTLTAKAFCAEDGREGVSLPLGVSFFPVASVKGPAPGSAEALPDAFVAEGGVGGTPTTFVGCIGTSSGTVLGRVNTDGQVTQTNASLPFPCSINASFTDRNNATGKRWLLEPDVGVFAFDQNLNITSFLAGNFLYLAVAPDGDAIVWDHKATNGYSLARVAHNPGNGVSPIRWVTSPTGQMTGNPVVSQGTVFVSIWQSMLGQQTGTMVVQRFGYAAGQTSGTNSIQSFGFGEYDMPVVPAAQLADDGQVIYYAIQSGDQKVSQVVACATNANGCGPTTRRWASPLLNGAARYAILFSKGTFIAALGDQETWFLSATDGHVINVGEQPIRASGSLTLRGLQIGNGSDFYILNGPAGGYATELIAADSPTNGELWRLNIEGGLVPLNALTMAVDDAGQAWLRVGTRQVLPLSLTAYRMVKGANPTP